MEFLRARGVQIEMPAAKSGARGGSGRWFQYVLIPAEERPRRL